MLKSLRLGLPKGEKEMQNNQCVSRWHRGHNKRAEEYVRIPKITPYEWQPQTTHNLTYLLTKRRDG